MEPIKPISDKVYGFEDIIKDGRCKPKSVGEMLDSAPHKIFALIKKGYLFSDDVLSKAHITKTVRDVRVYNEIAEHIKDNKAYAKDTASMKTILKSFDIDTSNMDFNRTDEETVEDIKFLEE